MEDEVPFEDYCKTMREETTWAGHVELQATSLVTQTNICIHQVHYSMHEWLASDGECLRQ